MKTFGHILASLLFIPLYPFFGNAIFICMAASVLADIDSVVLIMKNKAFSIKKLRHLIENVHETYQKRPKTAFKDVFYLFHSLEFNILLLALAFFWPVLGFISLGFLFHAASDALHHGFLKMPVLRWLFLAEFLRLRRK